MNDGTTTSHEATRHYPDWFVSHPTGLCVRVTHAQLLEAAVAKMTIEPESVLIDDDTIVVGFWVARIVNNRQQRQAA